MKRCCVIGLGYIGLPTAAIVADSGYEVVGVDVNQEVVSKVNNGLVHIEEPNLQELVSKVVDNGCLIAKEVPCCADVFIIAVPTPLQLNKESKGSIPLPDIQYVLNAARSLASVLKTGDLIILESTSPVGTTEKIIELISKETDLHPNQFLTAYCPERVLPGQILKELVQNDRVIGGINNASSKAGKEFYSSFCNGSLMTTNARTAEMVKLTENAFRDVNIAFANELSLVCDQIGINERELIRLANHHPRVNILQPGCGVGGHCIAVDPWFIASESPALTPLIQSARKVNEQKSEWVIDKVDDLCKKLEISLARPPVVGCLGLTFKPDVDDIRHSPALLIISKLIARGLNILTCEPNLTNHEFLTLYPLEKVLVEADLIVILVAHSAFKNLDCTSRNVFDLCGVTEKN